MAPSRIHVSGNEKSSVLQPKCGVGQFIPNSFSNTGSIKLPRYIVARVDIHQSLVMMFKLDSQLLNQVNSNRPNFVLIYATQSTLRIL